MVAKASRSPPHYPKVGFVQDLYAWLMDLIQLIDIDWVDLHVRRSLKLWDGSLRLS
jgi:hypothetical protein